MATTVGQVLFDVELWLKRIELTRSIGRPELKTLLVEVAVDVAELVSAVYPDWFMKSATFTSATSISLPVNYRQTVLIEIPSATAGGARLVPNEEWETRVNNTRLTPTSTDPLARLDTGVITLAPSSSGKHFFLFTISEDDIVDDSTDLETLLPKMFIQLVVLRMQELARIRHYRIPVASPSNAEKAIAAAKRSTEKLMRSFKPFDGVNAMSQKPATLPKNA